MSGLTTTVAPAAASARDPAQTSGTFHIPSLDGVRALAFLMVFVSHAGLRNLVPGGFGVTIFFVLSGYLITTLLRLEVAKDGSIALGAFYIRRSLRILPLLYLTLGVALLLKLAGQLGGELTAMGVFAQVFHWSNYYLIAHGPDSVVGGTIVLWSLAVEEHFYLLFPFLYRAMSRGRSTQKQGWLLAAACAACLVWRLVLIFGLHQPVVRTELGTDTRFDGLLFGCLMAIVANPALPLPPAITRQRIRSAALLALPVLLVTFLYRSEEFRATWRYSLQGIALLPLFAYVITARDTLLFRLLNTRLARELGVLSYSLYLVHGMILDWFGEHLHASKLVQGTIALIVAILVAKLLQFGVERPMLQLRRRFMRVRT